MNTIIILFYRHLFHVYNLLSVVHELAGVEVLAFPQLLQIPYLLQRLLIHYDAILGVLRHLHRRVRLNVGVGQALRHGFVGRGTRVGPGLPEPCPLS